MYWICLIDSADGDFVVTLKTKATVYHDGKIVWEPPAIYKSYCPIDVEFFPFDIQECFLKFGTWTYNGDEVDLMHVCNGTHIGKDIIILRGIDLKDYYKNVEWDVINVTARRKVFYELLPTHLLCLLCLCVGYFYPGACHVCDVCVETKYYPHNCRVCHVCV